MKRWFPFVLVPIACLVFLRSSGQDSSDIEIYIATYKDLAIAEMQRSGIPSAIILAQGIHETEAGTSELVKKSNNHFGIKCKNSWNGSVVYHDDDERGECFRSYEKPEDSYRDHTDFLKSSPRYAFLFKFDPMDYASWAYGLKKAGYATNVHYPQILIKLIEDYNLQQYTLIAMGKIKYSGEISIEGTQGRDLPHAGTSETVKQRGTASVRMPPPQYPEGEFVINNTKVIYVHSGTSLLAVADQYHIPLSRLTDFNDMKTENVLEIDQLLFLQRKRKLCDHEFHVVQPGESLYQICQKEGIRFDSMLEINKLSPGSQPVPGDKIMLQPD